MEEKLNIQPSLLSENKADDNETKFVYHFEVFNGPLDLLLTLIIKNKIDIYDISITELLKQYMEQINLMRETRWTFLLNF